jgi:hypothetical protein
MQAVHKPIARQSTTNRSAVTNGSKLLVGIDGRSPGARRFRDLIQLYEAEIGGALTEVERGLIKQAAALTLRTEQLQAAIVEGRDVNSDEIIRLSSEHRRLLSSLRSNAGKREPQGPDLLRDYLATSKFQLPDDVGDEAELEPESTPIP